MSPDRLAKTKPLYHWLSELDRILRGEATRPSDIQQADIRIPVVGISGVIILLAVIYGMCMGVFALVRGVENSAYQQALQQTFASMCKVPLLYMLTLVVTFPSLYVFNALVGSQLKVLPVLKLLVASLAVNLAVLASMGPILAFFSVSTPNYPFIVLLNVLIFAIAGALGLIFLVQTLNRLTVAQRGELPITAQRKLAGGPVAVTAEPIDRGDGSAEQKLPTVSISAGPASVSPDTAGPLDQLEGIVLGHHVRKVFACWIIVFGLVGAQMGWVLRPFIGSPSAPFQWFRPRQSNFFEAVWNALQSFLLGG